MCIYLDGLSGHIHGNPATAEKDREMGRHRKARDWEKQISLALDPDRAREYRQDLPLDEDLCSMCGSLCAMKRKTA